MQYLIFRNVARKGSLKKDQRCEVHTRYECLHSDFKGYVAANKSQNPERKQALIREFLGSFSSIPMDDQIAEKCGEIRAALERVGTPIGPYDLIIAATAIVKDVTLVTHNTKEFSRVKDIKLEDWE